MGTIHFALAAVLALAPGQEDDVRRLEAWPELAPDVAEAVAVDVQRLRKAHTEEMGRQAREALIAAGAGAAPLLIEKLGKEKDEAASARIREVLQAITAAEHTRLLAAEFDHRSQTVRTWCLFRVAELPDAGTRDAAVEALAAILRVKEPKREDQAERLAAALAVTAAGSIGGLDELLARAETSFGEHGARMRVALEAVRGPEATERVRPALAGERARAIAALNLLAGCGDESAVPLVKPFLDQNDNSLRIAAINALRGIVDGDPPLDKLPVFQAIELAKEWKARV